MANVTGKKGLRPINQPYGNIRCNYYEAATGTAFYMYQPVDLDANGRVVVSAASNSSYILGSVVGMADDAFGPISDSYSGYIPANPASVNSAGLVEILVADDPQQLFVIEEDTGGSVLDAQAIGAGALFTYTATTGSTVSGIANVVLDRSTIAATTDMTLRIVKKLDKPDNAYGNYCKWIVSINRHRLAPGAKTLGESTLI